MDPYSVLGLASGATETEVKTAYRNLAKTCHPDLHPNDPVAEQRFREISEAYDRIRNPQPEPIFHASRFDEFPFASPFDDLFGNLRGFTRQQRNNDLHVEVRLTLEDVYYGKEAEITVPSGIGNPPRVLKVRIPPGVDDGVSLRVPRAGDHSSKAHPPGDLYLLLRILPHGHLLRAGRNLTTIVPVTAFDVLLGKEIEVIGIDGRALRIAVPSGFDTSRKLRLAGQGMPDQNQVRGDLLIELFVTFPLLTEEQRALVAQAAGKVAGGY